LHVSQVLTLYTTPVIYLYMDRLKPALKSKRPGVRLIPSSNRVDTQHAVSIMDWQWKTATLCCTIGPAIDPMLS